MMDRLLLIVISVTMLAPIGFGFALCKAAARADAGESHQRSESLHLSQGAMRSAMPTAVSLAGKKGHSPAGDERPMNTPPVFIVDEHGEREKVIEIKVTPSPIRVDTKQPADPEPAVAFPQRDARTLRCLHQQRCHPLLTDRPSSWGLRGVGSGQRRRRQRDL